MYNYRHMDDSRIRKLVGDVPCLIEQCEDLYYLTGLQLSKGRLLVGPHQSTLFVDGRYYESVKHHSPCPVAQWIEFKKLPAQKIAFDSAFVTYDAHLELKRDMPQIEWIPRPHPVQDLRMIKDKKEIQLLKKAAQLTWQGYRHIASILKEGMTEEEVAFEFEFFCRKNGASGLAFESIIAFGENGSSPHHRAGKTELKNNQAVLIDVGAVVDHYHGDMTRFVHFGKPEERVLQLEKWVRRAKELAIQAIKPGVRVGELDQIVQDYFEKHHVKQLYTHSLGHGIGLETHESIRIRYDGADRDLLLKPGMVFTIEPGLYEPGVGGVRLEDMVVVTETGCENLFPQD